MLTLDTIETLHPEKSSRLETREEVKDVVLDENYPHQAVKICRGLPKEIWEALTTLVQEFKEIFA